MTNCYVEIVDYDTEVVVRRLGPHTRAAADRIEDGANINMNHEQFFTRIVEEDA